MAAAIEQIRQDLARLIADSTVIHAVVGAGDLAAEKIRGSLPELSGRFSQAQTELDGEDEAFQRDVGTAPEQKALPERAQAAVGEAVVGALTAYADVMTKYADLAGRGKSIVDRVLGPDTNANVPEPGDETAADGLAPVEAAGWSDPVGVETSALDVLDPVHQPAVDVVEPTETGVTPPVVKRATRSGTSPRSSAETTKRAATDPTASARKSAAAARKAAAETADTMDD
ncbi:MAG: hypothetical protein ACR2GB_03890 [Nocardioidaceae bacterium]